MVMFSLTPKGQSICKVSLCKVSMNTIKTKRALKTQKKKIICDLKKDFTPFVILVEWLSKLHMVIDAENRRKLRKSLSQMFLKTLKDLQISTSWIHTSGYLLNISPCLNSVWIFYFRIDLEISQQKSYDLLKFRFFKVSFIGQTSV